MCAFTPFLFYLIKVLNSSLLLKLKIKHIEIFFGDLFFDCNKIFWIFIATS